MGKKILIVDDEDDIRQVVRTVLEAEDYEIVEAKDGKEAITMASEEKPDLILMDVMMPEVDGWEACKRIKSDEATRDIMIAMLTVKSQDENKVKSFDEAMADWHIAKPIRRQRLIQTVQWLLDKPIKRGESDIAP